MDVVLNLIAAFGGGVFAASIGALPAFIMTGVFSISGALLAMAGAPISGFVINSMAFGPLFGPMTSFAGGVAAAAYAKKRGYMENGADIATALNSLGKPDVLLVGGVFGMIGFALLTWVVTPIFTGKIATDGPGIIVFFSGLLARLIFGGKIRTGDKFLSQGTALAQTLVIAFSYALVVAGIYVAACEGGYVADDFGGVYHVLIFGMCAVGLVFAEFGQAFAGCHHICIITAEAVVAAYGKGWGAIGSLCFAVVCGIIAGILCDFESNTINSGTDSHIDGPAFAIFIMTIVLSLIFN